MLYSYNHYTKHAFEFQVAFAIHPTASEAGSEAGDFLHSKVKEERGIYYYADEFPDELQIIQKNNPRVILSYGPALYLWDMSDRVPHEYDVTVPQGFNASRIKKAMQIYASII